MLMIPQLMCGGRTIESRDSPTQHRASRSCLGGHPGGLRRCIHLRDGLPQVRVHGVRLLGRFQCTGHVGDDGIGVAGVHVVGPYRVSAGLQQAASISVATELGLCSADMR